MKVVFAGSPDFAVPALRALLSSHHDVVAVYSQPDRPRGRGRQMAPTPVKVVALEAGCTVLTPASLRETSAADTLASFEPDVMVVVAYGLILPTSILSVPRYGGVNIHPSLLPRWRGAAPIQSAIVAGDQQTAVAIMSMDEGMDTGPIYHQVPVDIPDAMTSGELHEICAHQGAEQLLSVLGEMEHGRAVATPQSQEGITHSHKISKQDANINWQQTAVHLHNRIRAYNPFPVAYSFLDGVRYRLWSSAVIHQTVSASPGVIIDVSEAGIDVATLEGVLRITEWQAPGKRRINTCDWLLANAQRLIVGENCFEQQ